MVYHCNNNIGLVFNIQSFSVHDGPGIRDLLFIKGCPLRCKWCSNPESINDYPEITYNHNRCIGSFECALCKKACPNDAIKELINGKVKIERKLCNNCGKCAEVCPANALKLLGEYLSIDKVLKALEENSAFYLRSGGGVTISGGEPLSQAEFVYRLLKECKGRGIDTAVETSGYGVWEKVEKVCRYANLIFYDIKCMDSGKHKCYTGANNKLILENIERLSIFLPQTPIIARTPIIPGFNDSADDIEAIVNFLRKIQSLKEYELLPYHRFGESKYTQLGVTYPFRGVGPPTEENMNLLRILVKKRLSK